MSMPATSTKTTKLATSLIDEYALLGWRAMLTEVNLSPKPGLVDRINCGAHKDMALEDFHRSALAIQGWLPRFIEFGACRCRNGTGSGTPRITPNWYGLRR